MIITNSTFLFGRHAHTNKKTEGGQDIARTLSETGKQQAVALEAKLARSYSINQVITSTAERTIATASIVLRSIRGQRFDSDSIPSLYTLPNKDEAALLDKMFAELGHAPLAKYVEHAHAEVIHKLARGAREDILAILGDIIDEQEVLIMGHAIVQNALILQMFPPNPDITEIAMKHVLGECGMIEVIVGEDPDDISISVIN